ncbi:MAG: flagellar protein FlaG, partial [Desulfobulbaceae bacterium]|nr:flagellar protein FlaG [Desulfobulbaceae bacterium]
SQEIVAREDANRYAEEIQGRLDKMGSNLQFSVDEKTESVVFKFTSKTDGEVIRQIPSEKILELRSKLDDLLGLIFDKRV